ncbi:transposase [Candidatus Roizmanbacteria bacterium]|nr:transposase [Candidatus Roizmanbacteria bacterium]
MERTVLKSGEAYHIFNKSIANYRIFSDERNCRRFMLILSYYNDINVERRLSDFLKCNKGYNYKPPPLFQSKRNQIVKFIAYCIMPDHYHLEVKLLKEKHIYRYLNNIGNSYTKYFNTRFNRKGPLWQSPYKSVRIKSSEQLLHVSRYIHLNPTTAGLVNNPEEWEFSSYREYINNPRILNEIMHEILIRDTKAYRRFVENNKDYQRKLKLIQKLLHE